MIRATEIKIKDEKFNITPNLQEVFTQTSSLPLKKLNDQEREMNKNILHTLNFQSYVPKSGENKSGIYKYS